MELLQFYGVFLLFSLFSFFFQFFSLFYNFNCLSYCSPPLAVNLSVQFSSVAQSCPTLCDPMKRSMPGLPVHHQLPEFTQTHVHRVSDAIQPSHPLASPSSPASNFPSIRVFFSELVLCISWLKHWSFSISPSNEYSGLISCRIDWLISLLFKGFSRVFSNTTV